MTWMHGRDVAGLRPTQPEQIAPTSCLPHSAASLSLNGGWLFAERDIHLNAGHPYAVRFNEDTKDHEEVFMEVVDGAADLDNALTLETNQRL
jgi:hypothetical protein